MIKLFRATPDDYYDAPLKEFPAPIRLLACIILGLCWIFAKLMWRFKIEGEEKLAPQNGSGNVIISNHTSMAEVVALVTNEWFHGRPCRPVFKSEFATKKIVAWAFSRVGGIPVERGQADMKCLRRCQHALKRGENVLIYPEGTRIRTDDQPVEVHGGYALIAQMGKAPVVPVGVCGWRDITKKKGSFLMKPVKCWTRVGESLRLEDAPAELKRKERLAWLQDEGMARVYAIRDELRREHPGRH